MKRLWRGWVELWDGREPPRLLAMIRILVGLCLVVDYLDIARVGMVGPMFSVPPAGYAVSDGILWYGLALGAAVFMTIGLATRAACIVELIAMVMIWKASPDCDRGIHEVFRLVLPILALSQSHAIWSVDAAIRKRRGWQPPALVPGWPRRLILAQLVWIYFSAGLLKTGPEFGPSGGFLALANSITDPHLGRFDPSWVPSLLFLTQLGTAAVRVFEVGAPIYLVLLALARHKWVNRARWVWIATGASFHLGLVLLMPIGIFPWGMLALYPAMLRPEDSRYLQ